MSADWFGAGLTPFELSVLCYLKHRAGEDGSCCLSSREIAEACGMSRPTAIRAWKALESKGYIAVTGQTSERNLFALPGGVNDVDRGVNDVDRGVNDVDRGVNDVDRGCKRRLQDLTVPLSSPIRLYSITIPYSSRDPITISRDSITILEKEGGVLGRDVFGSPRSPSKSPEVSKPLDVPTPPEVPAAPEPPSAPPGVPPAPPVQVPEHFRKEWEEYLAMRRAKNWGKWLDKTRDRWLRRLSEHHDPAAVLRLSIDNEWRGLFPDKIRAKPGDDSELEALMRKHDEWKKGNKG